jgi:hypothetical protein
MTITNSLVTGCASRLTGRLAAVSVATVNAPVGTADDAAAGTRIFGEEKEPAQHAGCGQRALAKPAQKAPPRHADLGRRRLGQPTDLLEHD